MYRHSRRLFALYYKMRHEKGLINKEETNGKDLFCR